MWIRTQDNKYFFKCIGFEIGYHGFGDSKNVGVDIYGITQSNTKEYYRITLGRYKTKEKADEVLAEIQDAVSRHDSMYFMPSEKE